MRGESLRGESREALAELGEDGSSERRERKFRLLVDCVPDGVEAGLDSSEFAVRVSGCSNMVRRASACELVSAPSASEKI